MTRWKPDAHGRLQEAALVLFEEKGFDETTVAEIAEQAGLTKRTFFRYFPDKREVLFSGSELLEQVIVAAVAAAPAAAAPLAALTAGLDASAAVLQERREFAVRRRRVIAASPELQERELIKLASLAAAVAQALRARGVAEPTATLAADAGITVFRVAFERWADPANRTKLPQLLRESLEALRAATAA